LRLVGCISLFWNLEFYWGKLLGRRVDLHHRVGYLISGSKFYSLCVAVERYLQIPLQ
jgi:hypothetical protein